KIYSEDHEWIEVSEDGKIGTFGISTYAAERLGDIVYVELPELSIDIQAGEAIGAVESVKSVSDLLSPVSGKVVQTNAAVEGKPATINQSPEGEGWIAKIELADKGELETLMDEDAYVKFIKEES
ncbi:glycine cleavage system H protein, partial [Eremomyces bilateralis CBS 781.70]